MATVVYDAFEGDFAVIKSPDVHKMLSFNGSHIEYLRFPVSYQNMCGSDYIRTSFVIPHEAFDNDKELEAVIKSVFSLLSKNEADSGYIRGLCGSLCAVFLTLYPKRRTIQSIGNDSVEEIINKGTVSLETMEKFDEVVSYINANYTNSKINLSLLSKSSGLNKSFLSALFPKLTGSNFTDYIHHLRISNAMEMLTSSDKSISEIAYSCGFETIRSFNNVFKGVVGTTPSGFLSGFHGNENAGLDVSIEGMGSDIYKYNWKCNVDFFKEFEKNEIKVVCNDTKLKLWCHLRLRMIFLKGAEYKISFKAKPLHNSVGEAADKTKILCDFYYHKNERSCEHHHARVIGEKELSDGWFEYECDYKIPDNFKPSHEDVFSIYSTPVNDLGVSFSVKDICLKRMD